MDKKKCNSCGEAPHKCSCKNKEFTKAVIEIDNPEQITLMRRVVIPASMGDDTTVPPTIGKYHNVLLYYEANQKSYLYSSDGIPTQLVNGITNYEDAINLPQINGVTLLGDKSAADLELADAPMIITVANGNTRWSGADTAEDVYDFFLNKGKVNIVFDGAENYAYEVTSAGYIPEEEKMMCTLTAAAITAGETAEFDGNALVGTMTLYTADKAIDVSQIELQPKLYVTDFTGLDLNYNELSGVPATNAAIGMVKPGDGLEVASDGTLSISDIEQYAHFFDTVADMKASAELTDGDYVKTLGYYSLNDEGGVYYKISSTIPSGYYETLTSGLYAELIIEPIMNVKQFGAKGDGINDDTAVIQTALDNALNVFVPTGTYMVNAVTKIKLNSNNVLHLDNDATIKAITNSATSYAVLWLEDVTNVEIAGGTIEGERLTHTGTTGEWGHCIRLLNACDEIYIHDINLTNAWGDGLDAKITGSIVTERVHVDNARRNGYSIAAAGGFSSNDDFIENTNGTNPQNGVDIEPDDATQIPFNVVFNNLRTKNNARSGISVHLGKANQTLANVRINNLRSDGDNRGFLADTTDLASGEVTVVDPLITNSVSNGIYLQVDGNGVNFQIIRPVVTRYGVTSASGSGIYLNNGDGDGGNITIINPTVKNPIGDYVTNRAINIASGSGGNWKNLRIIDPLDLDGRFINFNGSNQNVMFTDKYECTAKDANSNYNIGSQIFALNTSDTYTTNRTITILDSVTFPDKTELQFINTGDYNMSIAFPSQYIYPLTSTAGATVTLGDKGAALHIKKVGATAWTVISQTGTVTVS